MSSLLQSIPQQACPLKTRTATKQWKLRLVHCRQAIFPSPAAVVTLTALLTTQPELRRPPRSAGAEPFAPWAAAATRDQSGFQGASLQGAQGLRFIQDSKIVTSRPLPNLPYELYQIRIKQERNTALACAGLGAYLTSGPQNRCSRNHAPKLDSVLQVPTVLDSGRYF